MTVRWRGCSPILGFSLQGNTKVLEGNQHADRDAQFRYLHGQVTEHAAAGQPVISVDTKKKELVGDLQERWQGIPSDEITGTGERARLP